MKYTNIFVIACLLGVIDGHKLRNKGSDVYDELSPLGLKTATKIAESMNPKVAYASDADSLPETVAPKRESTFERTLAKAGSVPIPANPIYDLDETIEMTPANQPYKKDFIISGYNGADEDEIMDKAINEYAVPALDAYQNKTSQKVLNKK